MNEPTEQDDHPAPRCHCWNPARDGHQYDCPVAVAQRRLTAIERRLVDERLRSIWLPA